MNINVNETLTSVLSYLNEAITTEFIKFAGTKDSTDLDKLVTMITDIRFQLDFTLMSSAVEIQELYDKYRNRPADESQIEIRMLFDLASFIKCEINDKYGYVNESRANNKDTDPYVIFILRLATLLTLHSNVVSTDTCQDESVTEVMDYASWRKLLLSNPWLVAAVCIRLIPGYYILDITINKLSGEETKVETRNPD